MDTVDIYHFPARGRRLSLRFLTYYIFKQEIQVDTHDSIEDARAALLLHRTFQEREAEGTFDELLREIYAEGKRLVSGPANDAIISKTVF
jgi:PAB-dependent poly(A)-specific ribonuclease subunit 2